jgi:hypothetical protein
VSWEVSFATMHSLLPLSNQTLRGSIRPEKPSQAVQYLEAAVHPMRRQTSAAVAQLLDGLDDYDLTKSLQIVNLAPTTLVELHVVRCPLLFHSLVSFSAHYAV